jgi:hypothetical protein
MLLLTLRTEVKVAKAIRLCCGQKMYRRCQDPSGPTIGPERGAICRNGCARNATRLPEWVCAMEGQSWKSNAKQAVP